jgi:phage head maturation protease
VARDLHESVKRGDISGMSFGFRMRKASWNASNTERTLHDVELLEISPTAFPAYRDTSVSARSLGLPSDSEAVVYSGIVEAPISDEEKMRLQLRVALLSRL